MEQHMDRQQRLRRRLEDIVRADPDLSDVLHAARRLALPKWRLVAGCLYQTVWNLLTNRPARTGIKDYDLVYFDDTDLSWEAEDQVVRRVEARICNLSAPVEIRNQARVHLWFKQRFGADYPPLRSADEGLTRYASAVHAIGVRLEPDDRLDIIAPFGHDDLFAMVIRPNRVMDNEASYEAKAARAKAIWSELVVVPWSTRSAWTTGRDGRVRAAGLEEATDAGKDGADQAQPHLDVNS
jgi:hypothetical protein